MCKTSFFGSVNLFVFVPFEIFLVSGCFREILLKVFFDGKGLGRRPSESSGK